MAQVYTFKRMIERYGFGDNSACPLNILLESTKNSSTPFVLPEGTRPESIQQGPHFREYDDRATTIGRLFPTLFNGYNEVDCNGTLNIEFMDDCAELDVGWAASIHGILKVMYLSPEYLEYDRYGMGWFYSNQTEPTDTFDITVRHAKAILAAAQTQLDDLEGLESTSDPKQHEVTYSRFATNRFKLLTPTDSCLFPKPYRHHDRVDYLRAQPEHSSGTEADGQKA